MNTSEKLKAVADNVEKVYAAGEKRCRERHCCILAKGDGTDTLTFSLPFEPDVLYVFTNAPEVRVERSNVVYLEIDFSALGQLVGKKGGSVGNAGAGLYSNNLCNAKSAYGMYHRADNGTVTISNVTVPASDLGLCRFAAGVDYAILASKLDLLPLKARIEESVRKLPDTACTAYYQSEKVNEAFTAEQWTLLMSEKPNCTFTMA